MRALGTRLGTEQPRLPPDALPLELLDLVGVENPRFGDVLPWQHQELARVFWDAFYAARPPMSEAQHQAEKAATARRLGRYPVLYRHPKTGETWSGRGLRPKWLQTEIDAGRSLIDFEVKEVE